MVGTHVVIRAFDVSGTNVQPGQLVDASGWKNTERLVSTKYLRVATPVDRKALTVTDTRPKAKKLVLKKR
jgi:hypothetical protein